MSYIDMKQMIKFRIQMKSLKDTLISMGNSVAPVKDWDEALDEVEATRHHDTLANAGCEHKYFPNKMTLMSRNTYLKKEC